MTDSYESSIGDSSASALTFHQNAMVIDVHADPSMKTHLARRMLWKTYKSPKNISLLFRLRTSMPALPSLTSRTRRHLPDFHKNKTDALRIRIQANPDQATPMPRRKPVTVRTYYFPILCGLLLCLTACTSLNRTPVQFSGQVDYRKDNSVLTIVGDTQRTSVWEHWFLCREQNDEQRSKVMEGIVRQSPALLLILGDLVFQGDAIHTGKSSTN